MAVDGFGGVVAGVEGAAGPEQGIVGPAVVPVEFLLGAVPVLVRGVLGKAGDVEWVHHRRCGREFLVGGGLEPGEPVHRDHPTHQACLTGFDPLRHDLQSQLVQACERGRIRRATCRGLPAGLCENSHHRKTSTLTPGPPRQPRSHLTYTLLCDEPVWGLICSHFRLCPG